MGRAKYSRVLAKFQRRRERIGLVGPNGAGKSSLLRLLAGVDRPFGGTVVRAKGLKLGYLAQGVADETESTLQDLVDAALARATHEESGVRNKALRTMLSAFGFAPAEYDRPLRSFSGGQRAKVDALTHVLDRIEPARYLILDGNRLTISTSRRSAGLNLSSATIPAVTSSFRTTVTFSTGLLRASGRSNAGASTPTHPHGLHTPRTSQRKTRASRRSGASTKPSLSNATSGAGQSPGLRATHTSSDYSQVRSREKQLARIEATTRAPSPAAPERPISVRLRPSRRAGSGFAFEARGLSKAYDQQLFSGLAIDVGRGERLGIVGPNGSGKSTASGRYSPARYNRMPDRLYSTSRRKSRTLPRTRTINSTSGRARSQPCWTALR